MNLERVTDIIIGCAIMVHKELGPGLLESPYEACMAFEISSRGLFVERQKQLPVIYRGIPIDCLFRMDMVVEGKVVLEIKAVSRLEPIHEAQLLNYLRLSKCPVGLLMNFNSPTLKAGLKRIVLGYDDPRRPRRLGGK